MLIEDALLGLDSWLANFRWYRKWTAYHSWYQISQNGASKWVRIVPYPENGYVLLRTEQY